MFSFGHCPKRRGKGPKPQVVCPFSPIAVLANQTSLFLWAFKRSGPTCPNCQVIPEPMPNLETDDRFLFEFPNLLQALARKAKIPKAAFDRNFLPEFMAFRCSIGSLLAEHKWKWKQQ